MKSVHFCPATIKTVFIAVFLASALGGLYYGISIKTASHENRQAQMPKKPPIGKRVEVKQVRPGWWETRRSIYYDIPARILFALPKDKVSARQIAADGWAEFAHIGDIFNPYAPDSETARLNKADTTDPITVSKAMRDVLMLCRKLFRQSDGALDPTMLPVKSLWQDAVQSQQVPSDRDILRTLDRVGFDNVVLLPQKRAIRLKKPGIRFDFGAVAKGYAVDRVVGLLKARGVSAALVQLGGEIAAFGENGERPWRIGVQHPLDMESIWGVVTAETPLRVSTSGNYRQPLIIDSHQFYHIFSPQTGKPVSEKVLGVTTVSFGSSKSSAFCDGAATAITVMGAEAGMALARQAGIDALILKRAGDGRIKETMTTGLKPHYQPKDAGR